MSLAAINLKQWIEEHRHLLKPPVGNRQVWDDEAGFFVNIIGGPNARTDYHIDPGAEFFYQIEGAITLRVVEDGKHREVPIREGEIFLLPPFVPHSPQRPPATLGLVIERPRREDELDGLVWYCDNCRENLYEDRFHFSDFALFGSKLEKFYADEAARTCGHCRTIMPVPGA
ncbi:MAG: 3-hydroxyanthranilate 3,4-dioxygenase [Candidatus Binataceae bacterium]|nr:3-hydroxyanthranilate 3,4-dioxygenase [Candidatus Binataceae bacterium]